MCSSLRCSEAWRPCRRLSAVAHGFGAEASIGDRESAAASGGLAPVEAASELLKALFQAILNDLHCIAGRLPCGCRALLRSLDGYLEHFPRKLGLHREVILNLAERLVSTGQV